MKALLVLVVLHVSNVFVVTLNTNESNTSKCSWTNTQTHFNQHNNMNILAVSRDMLFNHLWKLEKWKFEQSLQLSNNMISASSFQISNNELMQSTNTIIRIFQSTLFANPKQSKKNWHSKTSTINVFISISIIQLTFTAATFRYIAMIEKLNGKKKWSLKKKGSILKNNKMEAMINTLLSKRACSSQEQVSITDVDCDQLFLVQRSNKHKSNYQHYLQLLQIFFPSPATSKQVPITNFCKAKLVQVYRSQILHNFDYYPMLQCLVIFFFTISFYISAVEKWKDNVYLEQLSNQLQLLAQTVMASPSLSFHDTNMPLM
ncbi:hypothetical protein RFI_25505 [Reticulomyxa filosa]|uniref:Uncharacterized protein n=1 Tax=Reticulomyxa filosa TaxID=46433 RepID=X6MEQ8_RETFI|nr:hypothetical protein RFI_25505 [Reticulomyxa filosa]|eukprot:ETO11872.1 hypothetical protein RFI_25505 [Reticulomyxa filosa]